VVGATSGEGFLVYGMSVKLKYILYKSRVMFAGFTQTLNVMHGKAKVDLTTAA